MDLLSARVRLAQLGERFASGGLAEVVKETVYFGRQAAVIARDLQGLSYDTQTLERQGMLFADVTPELLQQGGHRHTYRSRYLKALHYLREGYGGHCLIAKDRIVGDVWYFPREKGRTDRLHDDVKLLGLHWDEESAYSFDSFVDPEYRSGGVSGAMLNNSLCRVSALGFRRVLGYYWRDNLPAVWNARVANRFVEIGDLSLSRIGPLRFGLGGS